MLSVAKHLLRLPCPGLYLETETVITKPLLHCHQLPSVRQCHPALSKSKSNCPAVLASTLRTDNDGFTQHQALQYFIIRSICQPQHNGFDNKLAIRWFKHKGRDRIVHRDRWLLNLELLEHQAGFIQRRGRLLRADELDAGRCSRKVHRVHGNEQHVRALDHIDRS